MSVMSRARYRSCGPVGTCAVATRVAPCDTPNMAFVKLDTAFLASTTWIDRDARDIMLTAMLMADLWEITEPEPQIGINTLDHTGWDVPPGWYGFIPAAGPALSYRAGVAWPEDGVAALERLGSPEPESRSQEYGGRRLVRVQGGFLLLNYVKYREKDHTTAERSKRYRDKRRAEASHRVTRDCVTPVTKTVTPTRDVTHADADADADADLGTKSVESPTLSDAVAPDPRVERAIALWHRVEAHRVAKLQAQGRKPKPGKLRDAARKIIALTKHVRDVESCDEETSWQRVGKYGIGAIDEAAADDDPKWGPKARSMRGDWNEWRPSRYDGWASRSTTGKSPTSSREPALRVFTMDDVPEHMRGTA